jgi:hypothetical protein
MPAVEGCIKAAAMLLTLAATPQKNSHDERF